MLAAARAQRLAQPDGVEKRSRADDARGGQPRLAEREQRHQIDGIGGYQQDSFEPRPHQRTHASPDDHGAASCDRQPVLVVMRRRTCRDHRHPSARRVGVVARPDAHRARQRVGIGDIRRFGVGELAVGVDEDNLAEQRAQHQGVGCGAADVPGSDDGDAIPILHAAASSHMSGP